MGMLGIKVLLVTNAAGALNPEFKVGDLMAITDHINLPGLAGNNPLVGPNEGRLGPRFPPLTDAYDQELRELLADVFTRLQYTQYFRQGVYTCVSGACVAALLPMSPARMTVPTQARPTRPPRSAFSCEASAATRWA